MLVMKLNESFYEHEQRGIIRPILLVFGAVLLVIGACFGATPPAYGFIFSAAVCALVSFFFGYLRVCDKGDRLLVSFGPVPLFRKAIHYDTIKAVRADRSNFISGWGIHMTPNGWLWNIGGFDCVRISRDGEKDILIGTDDPEGLVNFLVKQMGESDGN